VWVDTKEKLLKLNSKDATKYTQTSNKKPRCQHRTLTA
jgi:hypothetical protein